MKKIIFFTLLILLATNFAFAESEMTICTMDAMQCSDGTWVGRSGPNCEFICGSGDISVTDIDPAIYDIPGPVDLCTEIYEPVCAILPMPKCLIEHKCKMPQPGPTTYSNACNARNAGANILYKGKCDFDLDTDKKEIPNNCGLWFDGCNTCGRSNDGGPMICTLMACETYSEPYCMKYEENQNLGSDISVDDYDINKKIPENCISWFDGCNMCGRSNLGENMACTERACLRHEQPYCVEYEDLEDLDGDHSLGEYNDEEVDIDLDTEIRVINKVQAKKLFGIFSVNLNTKLFVEKDSGQLIREKKPWYSFLLF